VIPRLFKGVRRNLAHSNRCSGLPSGKTMVGEFWNGNQLGHHLPRTGRCSRTSGWAMLTPPSPRRRRVVWLPALTANFRVRRRRNLIRREFPIPINRSRFSSRASELDIERGASPRSFRSSIMFEVCWIMSRSPKSTINTPPARRSRCPRVRGDAPIDASDKILPHFTGRRDIGGVQDCRVAI
jgi:hypothetical protein